MCHEVLVEMHPGRVKQTRGSVEFYFAFFIENVQDGCFGNDRMFHTVCLRYHSIFAINYLVENPSRQDGTELPSELH